MDLASSYWTGSPTDCWEHSIHPESWIKVKVKKSRNSSLPTEPAVCFYLYSQIRMPLSWQYLHVQEIFQVSISKQEMFRLRPCVLFTRPKVWRSPALGLDLVHLVTSKWLCVLGIRPAEELDTALSLSDGAVMKRAGGERRQDRRRLLIDNSQLILEPLSCLLGSRSLWHCSLV